MTSEQDELRGTLRRLLTRESDTRAAMTSSPGHDEKLWARLTSLGLTALAAPSACGATFHETGVVLSELGRFLTPGPFLGSVVAAAAVESTGSDELLAEIADGATVSLGWRPYALNAQVADVFLLPRDDGLYALSRSEVTVTPAGGMDPTRRLATVEPVGTGRFLGVPDLARVRDVAAAALAAASAVMTGEDLAHTAATAQVWCTEAFSQVAAEMIQLHGGIAITWEHDAHLYFKRAHGNTHLFGSPREHVSRLGVELGR